MWWEIMYVKQSWAQCLAQANYSLNESFCHDDDDDCHFIPWNELDQIRRNRKASCVWRFSSIHPSCLNRLIIDDLSWDWRKKWSETWMNLSLRSDRTRISRGCGNNSIRIFNILFLSCLPHLLDFKCPDRCFWVRWSRWTLPLMNGLLYSFSRRTSSIVCSVSFL